MPREVTVGNRTIGDDRETFVTLELGPTHGGFSSAYQAVALAKEAGADAIKYQIFRPEEVLARDDLEFTFEVLVDRESGASESVTARLFDLLKERTLSDEQWEEVANHAHACQVQIFFTVGTFTDIELAVNLGATSIKIASGDITFRQLIERAAQTGLPVQLDSGAGTTTEVRRAVDWVERTTGNGGVIAHHCPSGYPAQPRDVRLRQLSQLKEQLDCPVAFSDHSPGWEMDIAAIALGANMIEKTVTADRSTRSIEHMQSIEWGEVASFVSAIRSVDLALLPLEHTDEPKASFVSRRSPYLAQAATAGTRVSDLVISYLRPNAGLSPSELHDLSDWTLKSDFPSGHCLRHEDLELL